MSAPLISVIMPAYNARRWIAAAMRSALQQDWPRVEVIVVDDGSTDDTLALARGFAARRVNVVGQDNRGASAARNHGLSLAQGDYIQWLDADDMLAPGKLSAQLARAGSSTDRALFSAAFGEFHLNPGRARFSPTRLWQDCTPVEFLLAKLGGNLWMNPAVWLVSRALTELAGPWDERLSLDDDGEYFARVVAASEMVRFVPEAKVYYRRAHAGSLSRAVSESAAQSLLRSLRASIATLLRLEDSVRTRRAALRYLQTCVDLADCFHPDRPELMEEIETLAAALGGRLVPPRLSWKYQPIRRLFGWSAVRCTKRVVSTVKLMTRVERERLLHRRPGEEAGQ